MRGSRQPTVSRLISITGPKASNSDPIGALPSLLFTMSGAMHPACLFLLVTLTMTQAGSSAENIAPPCAHVQQVVESHFQLLGNFPCLPCTLLMLPRFTFHVLLLLSLL